MRGKAIDIAKLHSFLHKRADRLGRLRLNQKEFADELGVTNETISRVLSRMTDEGRVKKIKSEKSNIGVYYILDPESFDGSN